MLRKFLFIAGLLAIGILVGSLVVPGPGREQTRVKSDPDPAPLDLGPIADSNTDSLLALQHQLQQAQRARARLETQLRALQNRVEELEYGRDTETSSEVAAESENPNTEKSASQVRSSVQTLIEAGISDEQAAWIQERLDDIELQQLYLRDRATREGWLNKPRYHKQRREIQNAITELRDEVGDDAYDRLLYALGRANRVVVRDVMQNSPAAQYGLQGGDRIIEYESQRIFSSNELSTLVTEGSAGVMTLVRVERDGEIHDVYLPRGPLGIRMTAARVAP